MCVCTTHIHIDQKVRITTVYKMEYEHINYICHGGNGCRGTRVWYRSSSLLKLDRRYFHGFGFKIRTYVFCYTYVAEDDLYIYMSEVKSHNVDHMIAAVEHAKKAVACEDLPQYIKFEN